MKEKWKKSEKYTILIFLNLVVTLAILLQLKYADAMEQNTLGNYMHISSGSENMTYLKLPDILGSEEQDIQNLQSSLYMDTINLSMNHGHSENPEIITNSPYVYTLWLDDTNGNRDVYFRRSVDNGRTFGETVNLSNNPGGSINPTMIASKNAKNLYVVWEHIPGNNGEIFFTKSNDNGATFETPIRIGNNTGLNGFPQIALSENNSNIYVVWHDSENGIMLRRSIDNGATFESQNTLSNKNVDSQNPQISVSQDNNVFVAWQSNPQGRNGDIVFTRSTDNGATFEEPISISNENGSILYNSSELKLNKNDDRKKQNILSFHPRLVTVPESNIVYVIWYSGFNVFHKNYHLLTDIYFTRSTDNGATFEEPISLTNYSVWAKSTDNGAPFVSPISLSGYSGWTPEPQIAISQHNNLYVAWQSNPQGSNGEISFTKSNDNGSTFESPLILSNKNVDSQNPQISVSQDNIVYVAWQSNPQGSNGEISFTKSNDNGSTFESPLILSNKNVDSQNPQIAISQHNNVFLVWHNNATGNEEIMLYKAGPKNMNPISLNSIQKETGLQNNTTIDVPIKNPKRIALVERTFTDAAYDNSFYLFYNIKDNQSSNITKYTNLLSSKVIKQDSILPEFEAIVNHLKWLTPQSNITILTDADVHDTSSLFMDNGTIKYDVIILGHNEYVTQLEYDNLRQFVASGGLLVLLDGNVFYAEVKYDKENQTITLVKGHDWEFKGGSGSHSVAERWANETTEWVGSNYCECYGDDIRFGNNPFGVRHNEEQYITNPDAKIILDYRAYNVSKTEYLPRDFKIATYELDYKKGKVITLGLYTDDLLFYNNKFKRFFDSLLYYYIFREQN